MDNMNKGKYYKHDLINVLRKIHGIHLFRDVATTLADAVLPLKT